MIFRCSYTTFDILSNHPAFVNNFFAFFIALLPTPLSPYQQYLCISCCCSVGSLLPVAATVDILSPCSKKCKYFFNFFILFKKHVEFRQFNMLFYFFSSNSIPTHYNTRITSSFCSTPIYDSIFFFSLNELFFVQIFQTSKCF